MAIILRAKNIKTYVKNKYTIISGPYIETAEKVSITATNGNLEISSAKRVIFQGLDGGVQLGREVKYEPIVVPQAKPENEIPRCCVEFRTIENSYNGEFGFDWLRIAEFGLTDEYAYTPIGGYKNGIVNLTETEALNNLKNEYEKFTIKWDKKDDTEYYVPYLNLYSKEYSDNFKLNNPNVLPPPYIANFRILVEIENSIGKLEFEYDEEIFSINISKLSDKAPCNKCQSKDTITIICNKDFSTQKEICVYAYPINEDKNKRTLAGKIIVLPNDVTNRKSTDIVLVSVKTDIHNAKDESQMQIGTFTDDEKNCLRKFLYQALVEVNMKEQIWDLSKDKNFIANDKGFSQNLYKWDIMPIEDPYGNFPMFINLRKNFKEQYLQYSNYFTIFAFDVSRYLGQASLNVQLGEVEVFNKEFIKNVVLYKYHECKPQVVVHEIMHGFKLYHTHEDSQNKPILYQNKKYVFPKGGELLIDEMTTDNIMSYSHKLRTTWHWQWKIIRENL